MKISTTLVKTTGVNAIIEFHLLEPSFDLERVLTQLNRYDPVSFTHRGSVIGGHVLGLLRRHVRVITLNGVEYKVPVDLVHSNVRLGPRRTLSLIEYQRLAFIPEDEVVFVFRNAQKRGLVLAINRRHALITTSDDDRFNVPYSDLQLVEGDVIHQNRIDLLRSTAAKADELLNKHCLFEWSYDFDRATNRAGICRFDDKSLVLSNAYCIRSNVEDIHDTILHEIAHALVGPNHKHDRVWREQALEIGSTADVSSPLSGSRTRYIKTCSNCGWAVRAQRRNRRLICVRCGSKVVFLNFTPETWEHLNISELQH